MAEEIRSHLEALLSCLRDPTSGETNIRNMTLDMNEFPSEPFHFAFPRLTTLVLGNESETIPSFVYKCKNLRSLKLTDLGNHDCVFCDRIMGASALRG